MTQREPPARKVEFTGALLPLPIPSWTDLDLVDSQRGVSSAGLVTVDNLRVRIH